MVIYDSKGSSTRLLLKVIRQMKLRVTKIKLFDCIQSDTICIPSTNQACNQNFSKGGGGVFEPKDEICMRLTDGDPGIFCKLSAKILVLTTIG